MEKRRPLRGWAKHALFAAALATFPTFATLDATAFAQEIESTASLSAQENYPIQVHKRALPTVQKQVGETNDDTTVFGANADAGNLESIPYRLTGTLPDNYDLWGSYRYIFTDTFDTHLSIDRKTIRAYACHQKKKTRIKGFQTTLTKGKLVVAWNNLKSAAPQLAFDDTVIVEYRATLKTPGKRAGQKQPFENQATLSYSNDNATGALGTTKPVQCTVYTYRLQVTKVDRVQSTPLSGARFSLTDENNRTISQDGTKGTDSTSLSTDADGTLSVQGLDAGTYTLTETEAPSGYQPIARPITLKVSTNVTDMTDRLKLDAQASDGAKVTSVDAGTGLICLEVGNSKVSSPTTESADPSNEGGTYHKTGNPFIDYWWALVLAVIGAIGLITYGLHTRRIGAAAPNAAPDYQKEQPIDRR